MAVATQDSITPPTAATNFKPIATAKPVTGVLLVSGGQPAAGYLPLCLAGPIWFTSRGTRDQMVLHISIAARSRRRRVYRIPQCANAMLLKMTGTDAAARCFWPLIHAHRT